MGTGTVPCCGCARQALFLPILPNGSFPRLDGPLTGMPWTASYQRGTWCHSGPSFWVTLSTQVWWVLATLVSPHSSLSPDPLGSACPCTVVWTFSPWVIRGNHSLASFVGPLMEITVLLLPDVLKTIVSFCLSFCIFVLFYCCCSLVVSSRKK